MFCITIPIDCEYNDVCRLLFAGGLGFGVVAARTVSTAVFTSSRPSVTGHADISKLVFSYVVLLTKIVTFISAFRVRSHSSAVDVKLVMLNATLFLVNIFQLF